MTVRGFAYKSLSVLKCTIEALDEYRLTLNETIVVDKKATRKQIRCDILTKATVT